MVCHACSVLVLSIMLRRPVRPCPYWFFSISTIGLDNFFPMASLIIGRTLAMHFPAYARRTVPFEIMWFRNDKPVRPTRVQARTDRGLAPSEAVQKWSSVQVRRYGYHNWYVCLYLDVCERNLCRRVGNCSGDLALKIKSRLAICHAD